MTNNTPKKQPRPIKFLQDIFELANGSTQLAAKLNLNAFTVENWRRCGIPQKYWDALYKFYGLSPGELYTVSKACRERITKPKPKKT